MNTEKDDLWENPFADEFTDWNGERFNGSYACSVMLVCLPDDNGDPAWEAERVAIAIPPYEVCELLWNPPKPYIGVAHVHVYTNGGVFPVMLAGDSGVYRRDVKSIKMCGWLRAIFAARDAAEEMVKRQISWDAERIKEEIDRQDEQAKQQQHMGG